jgi:hypothetical protein
MNAFSLCRGLALPEQEMANAVEIDFSLTGAGFHSAAEPNSQFTFAPVFNSQ